MKCPHCGYKHGWDNESMRVIDGNNGNFFTFPVKMSRRDEGSYTRYEEFRSVYACPSCFKTFIDD